MRHDHKVEAEEPNRVQQQLGLCPAAGSGAFTPCARASGMVLAHDLALRGRRRTLELTRGPAKI